MAECTPSEDEVRAAWVDREYEFGDTTDRARADFDRFLARVRRDAWNEGWTAEMDANNPYEQEDQT